MAGHSPIMSAATHPRTMTATPQKDAGEVDATDEGGNSDHKPDSKVRSHREQPGGPNTLQAARSDAPAVQEADRSSRPDRGAEASQQAVFGRCLTERATAIAVAGVQKLAQFRLHVS